MIVIEEYDMIVIIMCDYFNALFYSLQIRAAFCCAVAALIRERCLSKSLFYEYSV